MRRPPQHSPLFSDADLEPSLAEAVGQRRWMAEAADDSIDVVKRRNGGSNCCKDSDYWSTIADLWCACWMWPEPEAAPNPAVFASLLDEIRRRHTALPSRCRRHSGSARRASPAIGGSFIGCWSFRRSTFDESGRPAANPGFDAVLGNPPWDMLDASSTEKTFFRGSGIYRHQAAGRINRYQLFVERAMALTRRGGRIGLVLPSGFATDHTAAALRRKLLDDFNVDTIIGFDNRKAIFPIHRSVRFMITTSTVGAKTRHIACRFRDRRTLRGSTRFPTRETARVLQPIRLA